MSDHPGNPGPDDSQRRARVLVAGWIGSTNLGDELVFAGLRRLLETRGITPVAISQDPDATWRAHGVRAVSGTDPLRLARTVGQADAVLFGGGGLLQDETSPLNLPYHLGRIELARLRGTPFAAIGVGAGALDTAVGRARVRHAMRPAVAISVRDEASREVLEAIGVSGARVTADLAFALDAPAAVPADRVVVSLRRWAAGGVPGPAMTAGPDAAARGAKRFVGRLPAAAAGDPTPQPHVEAVARGLDAIAASTGLTIRFVALQADRDDAVHRRTAALMTATDVEFATPDLAGVLDEYARARVVISMRYHGGIAATLAGRPVVLIDYASKVSSLAGELGDGARLLAWDPGDLDTLPAALAAVLDRTESVVAARERLRDRQAGNLDVIDRVLGAGRRPAG